MADQIKPPGLSRQRLHDLRMKEKGYRRIEFWASPHDQVALEKIATKAPSVQRAILGAIHDAAGSKPDPEE